MPYYVAEVMTARQWRCACGFETRIFWTFEHEGDEPAPMIVPENVREAKREHMATCQWAPPAAPPVPDTDEIAMTDAEYTAWREHVHATLRAPGWQSPELRALGEDD